MMLRGDEMLGGRLKAAVAVAALGAAGLVALGAGLAVGQGQPEGGGAPHPGKAVFDANCAACHAAPDAASRIPSIGALNRLSAQTITTALTSGVMRAQGSGLSPRELRDVVSYLAAPEGPAGTAWIDANLCASDKRTVDLSGKPTLTRWGVDVENSRHMTAAQAGISKAQLSNLEVAWTFAMPKTSGLRSQGVVVGSTLFYAAGQLGYIVALDTQTGCMKWASQQPTGLRSSLAYGQLGPKGPMALLGSDNAGQLQALDAKTGKMIWRVDPRHDKTAMLTGTPLVQGDKIIVPISATDVGAAGRPTYECCKGHGAVAALDAATGRILWTWHTMEDAKPQGGKNSAGASTYGPSGAPIWSSPSIDLKRGLVFTSTGENTSPPATTSSDSMTAIDLATGKTRWSFQALKNDIWNMSCPVGRDGPPGRKISPNCYFYDTTDSILRDHDFGASPIILHRKGGHDLVVDGQKSGDVWALDIVTGKVVWHQKFGQGSALGGVHWGMATDGVRVFAPISDPGVPEAQSAAGLYAIDIASGKVAWQWRAKADCADGRDKRIPGCSIRYGLSAAPMVIDGTVVAGSLDGKLWMFDAATGKVLGVHDTAKSFAGVNGVPGTGGSIDATGVFAGDGMIFANSGYGSFNQQAGNVLVAFRAKK